MVAWIPILMHFALLLFMIGCVWWLKYLHKTPFIIIISLIATGLVIYASLACIPSFQRDSPYKWPISDSIYRIRQLFSKADNHENAMMEVALTDSPFRHLYLTPDAMLQPKSEQIMPHDIDEMDYDIMLYVLRNSDIFQEAEYALDNMRLFQIRNLWKIDSLKVDGNTILQKSQELADTCLIINQDGAYSLKLGMNDRARRVCKFIEWLYSRLSKQQRSGMRSWPASTLAQALAMNAHKSKRFDDMVLATSVQSKLHHISLSLSSGCRHCWSRHPFGMLKGRRPGGIEGDPVHENQIQKLVIRAIVSNSECLLNYAMITTTEEFTSVISEALQDRKAMLDAFRHENMDADFVSLKKYLLITSKFANTIIRPWFDELYRAASGYQHPPVSDS